MRHKLGLPDGVDDTVVAQVADDLLAYLERDHVDYTSFFRKLSAAARGDAAPGVDDDVGCPAGSPFGPDADAMDDVNPVYIPRNHLVEEALAAASAGDMDPVERLLAAITIPVQGAAGVRALRRTRPG